jgi:hypothetical protein
MAKITDQPQFCRQGNVTLDAENRLCVSFAQQIGCELPRAQPTPRECGLRWLLDYPEMRLREVGLADIPFQESLPIW